MNVKQIAYTLSMSAAAALFAGIVSIAQSPGAPQQPGTPGPQQPSPTNPTSPNFPGATSGGMPTSTQDYSDRSFITKALEGGMAEVQLGQLAQEKSQSNDVKQFGQKMVNDHGQMGDKWLKPVAQQMGISEPKGPSKKDKKAMEKLQGLSGQDFDREYITMMIKDHQKDLKEFKDEANAAQDPNVKQIAEKGSQVIEQHLQLIEQIAKAHNIDASGEMSSTK
jgi:putative membrane protein